MRAQHEDLHAAIAAHLRAQRRTAEVRRPLADAERHYTQLARDAQILAIWRDRVGVPCCRYCGKPITESDDAFDVEQMRAARACVDHYAPF